MIFVLALGVGAAFLLSGRLMELEWPALRGKAVAASPRPAVGAMAGPSRVRRTAQGHRVVLSLARREARRLLLHPVMVVALLLSAWGWLEHTPENPTDAYNKLLGQFYLLAPVGMLGCLVVHLVTSSPRRADLEEQFGSMPAGDAARTLALLLGCLAPAAASCVVVGLTWLSTVSSSETELLREPGLWPLAAAPLTVLGGLLLGVMLGRWAPWRGAGLVGLVVVIAVFFVAAESADRRAYLAPYIERAVYNKVGVYRAGSEAWHVAYIGGLCVMASIGALLRAPGRHLRLLLSLGAGAVLATAYAGWAQLP